jgi:hypothetical protein
LDELKDLTLDFNSAAQKISLSGIGPGAFGEKQTLRITAVSSDPQVVPNPMVSYSSPQTNGLLTIKPAANAKGTAVITVTVNDGGKTDNYFSRTFTVTVAPNTATASTASSLPALPATLTPLATVNGQFTFRVEGEAGSQYSVEASADLIHWTAVQTNTAPFDFTDVDSSQFSQRFYRTVSVP